MGKKENPPPKKKEEEEKKDTRPFQDECPEDPAARRRWISQRMPAWPGGQWAK